MSQALARGRWSRAVILASIIMLSCVVGPVAAYALDAAPSVPTVTLQQALGYARDRQPRIKSALAEYAARRAEARVPRAQWLPQIGATAQLFVATSNNTTASYLGVPEIDLPRIGASKSTTQATATWSPSASTLAGIGVGQEVYDFGRISAQIAVADAYSTMAKATAGAVGLDVALGVEETFHGVLAAKAVLAATQDAYKRAITHRDYAQAGTKSGMRPPIDLTRAQAGVSALEVRLIQARSGVQASRAALAAAMGSDQLEVDAEETPADLSAAPAFADALRTAAKHNPAILAALAKLDAQHAAVSAVTRELLPNVFASASLTGRAGGAAPSSGDTPYGGGWLPDVANWHVGLILQWNLFDATVLARRSAAKAHEDAARAELELARMSVGLAAERAYLDLDAALATLPGLHAAVDAARANEAQADARFKAGLGTIIELADAEALLTNSQLELAVGQFTVARARAALGRVMAQSFVRANQ
ncbi:MAG: outer rane efflux protein [bacterium]|nr:outer rane efflux protein [bacterium]